MRIGILSDTHNRKEALALALAVLRREGISTLFHCGDVTSLETARLMAGFTVHYVYGNGDADAQDIRQLLQAFNIDCTGGLVFSGELDGVKIAATHGHLAGKVAALVASGEYDYVFHGHTHIQRNVLVGRTRVINPGALGGTRNEGRNLCILDLHSGEIDFPDLDQA
ncbi:MAG TPA: metallophosphoesterase family protein [Bellilinea sp.]|nr:metallophosphoesterase family protein [Bellilinea sp.]